MTVSPQTISFSAAALLAVVAPLAAWWGGVVFGLGVFAAGALMLLNLGGWAVVVRQAIESTLSGEGSGLAALFYILKLLTLAGGLVGLLLAFPPLSVLLGCSVTVLAVIGVAIVGTPAELPVGEGYS